MCNIQNPHVIIQIYYDKYGRDMVEPITFTS